MSRLSWIRFATILGVSALFAAGNVPVRADDAEEQLKADLKLFEDAKLPHGDKDLIAFFRGRLLNDKDRERIEGLIKKLASNSFKEREQARIEVEKEGPRALSLLRAAAHSNTELEVKLRAEQCIKVIETKSPSTLVTGAARILKYRQTEGAAAILMEYLAFVPDDAVEEEIDMCVYSLALVGAKLNVLPPAVKTGKLNPLMVAALADKHAARRAIAALVVAHFGDAKERSLAAKLVTDEVLAVRLRAAQGLAMARDKSCVPVLVDLLDKAPTKIALQAEDLLNMIAQDKGPSAAWGETKELRQKSHTAWKEWSQKNQDRLDLAKLDIDSPFGSLAGRATKAAVQFVNGLMKYDAALLKKVTDVPFTFGLSITFNTREELDSFLSMFKERPAPADFKFSVKKVVTGAAYAKGASQAERDFLQAARLAQIHVVYIEGKEGDQARAETIGFFIRISGGQAKCIGIGEPNRAN